MVSDNDILISWGGLIGATTTVLITTLDDSIWLVSFVGTSSLPMTARLLNAATFLSALMGLALLCCALALTLEQVLVTKTNKAKHQLELTLQWIAVIFCWVLAAAFYVKKLLKRRRRRKHEARQENDPNVLEQGKESSYGSLPQQEPSEPEDDVTQQIITSQPCTIVMLTTLGFLDEISYFPALIVGQIFSIGELLLGTLFAGMIMLGIQAFLASQCKPLIAFLDDHVKLYGIIAVFAFILTIELILDYKT